MTDALVLVVRSRGSLPFSASKYDPMPLKGAADNGNEAISDGLVVALKLGYGRERHLCLVREFGLRPAQ